MLGKVQIESKLFSFVERNAVKSFISLFLAVGGLLIDATSLDIKTFSITTLIAMTLSIQAYYVTRSISDL